MRGLGLNRREAMVAAALASACTLALPALPALAQTRKTDAGLLLRLLLGLVVPATDTPGANTPDNARFITDALAAGLMGVAPDALEQLAAQLDARAAMPFDQAPPARRFTLLSALDDETFAPQAHPGPWLSIKALILMAYFTSEDGASKALPYEIVPGRYDPDLPVTPDWRPLSNDWSANGIKKAITPR